MKVRVTVLLAIWLITTAAAVAQEKPQKATYIDTRPWTEALDLLRDTTIVVIPLGAQSKEHGPHLWLRNDFLIAEYLKERLSKTQSVVIYPTVTYHYYPAFLEYAGSTSLQFETATNLVIDIIRVIAGHGPKKFYVLNTGVSTLAPLKAAKESLALQGILMTYTDILHIAGEAEKQVKQEPAGTHADEIETSMMLYMAPNTVDMTKARRDIPEVDGPGPLTLDPNNPNGRYSPTGIYGDATLATREKGRVVVEAMVEGINQEINALRKSTVPKRSFGTNYSSLIGTFSVSEKERVTITIENGRLMFEGKGPRKTELIPLGEDSFTAGTRGRVVFFRDPNGGYNTVYLNWESKDYLGKRTAR